VPLPQRVRNYGQFGARGFEVRGGREASIALEGPRSRCRRVCRVDRQRRQHVGLGQPDSESTRRNAHDPERPSLDSQLPSDDGGIAAEPALPEPVAEDHHALIPGPGLRFGEAAPERGMESEHPEQIRGSRDAADLFRAVWSDQIQGRGLDERERLERSRAGAPLDEAHRMDRQRRGGLQLMLVQRDDSFRTRVWKRPKEHGVDEREDCRVRADADRERQDRDRRKAGALAKRTKGVDRILAKALDHRPGSLRLRQYTLHRPSSIVESRVNA
jgi:hypothetical protein